MPERSGQAPAFYRPGEDRIEPLKEYAAALLAGAVFALVLANAWPESFPRHFGEGFRYTVNEVLMVPFFGIAALELRKGFAAGGWLRPSRAWLNPVFAAVGGICGPALIYVLLNAAFGSRELGSGWKMVVAADVVLAWLAARIAFGVRHPAVAYVLIVAILDDLFGLGVLSVTRGLQRSDWEALWTLLIGAGMAAGWAMRGWGVRSYWPYVVVCGGLSWLGLYLSNHHPAIALVFVVPFLPADGEGGRPLFDLPLFGDSAATRLEYEWKNLVVIALFAFGFANAGVRLLVGPGTWVVLASFLVGKPAGILSAAFAARRLGFPFPPRVSGKNVLVSGLVAGAGFTVALMISGEVFPGTALQEQQKLGALFSGVLVLIGTAVAKLVGPRHRNPRA